ncbi:hypothetical protein J1605_023318 [Eschrichtius robustus]|uniref:Uncharacterized protein n=1 Tax=Eschrichtius robustus TaxID=9764 RepID=A0AB34H5F0_ESCRO|nr:hypothetical protein J1605_023318 [Eschrichtius robustus]
MELQLAPSPTLPPAYLFASSSSSSSGSVSAITTSHSAAAAILPPGPESRRGSLGPVYQREALIGARAASRPRRSRVVSSPERGPKDGVSQVPAVISPPASGGAVRLAPALRHQNRSCGMETTGRGQTEPGLTRRKIRVFAAVLPHPWSRRA